MLLSTASLVSHGLLEHDLFRGTKLVFHRLAVVNLVNPSDSPENEPDVLASIARTPLDPAGRAGARPECRPTPKRGS